MGYQDPSGFGGCGSLEVFGEATASAAPGKSAFDDPAARQELEAFDAMRSLDDLDLPWPTMRECALKLVAAVDAIGKDVLQLGESTAQPL
jgi:hypothetical protein